MANISENRPEAILYRTVTLSNDEVLGLPTVPVDIIAAPGEGKAILPLGGLVVTHIEADGEYGDVSTPCYLGLYYGSGSIAWRIDADDLELLITSGDAAYSLVQAVPNTPVENTALQIATSNSGDFSGGDGANTLTVHVFYCVIGI